MTKELVLKGKSVIYTSNILNGLFNPNKLLRCSNKYYYISEITLQKNSYYAGLCTSNHNTYIISDEELLMIDMLLSWNALTSNSLKCEIMFSDIDWMRRRNSYNKSRVLDNHEKYQKIFKQLDNLYLIFGDNLNEILSQDSVFKLFNYKIKYESNVPVGIIYDFNELGKMLKDHNQLTTININIFDIKLSEFMKYKILRYMILSIYMNSRKKSFTRTHKSILKGISYYNDGKILNYYDYYCNNEHISQYLKRYFARLESVLFLLKECGYIEDYSYEKINTRQELQIGSGRVVINTKVYKRKKRKHT